MYMPSNALMDNDKIKKYPKEYRISRQVKDMYTELPGTYKKIFDSFGSGKETPPPVSADPPALNSLNNESLEQLGSRGVEGSVASSYLELVSRLVAAFHDLKAADADIAPLTKQTKSVSRAAKKAINKMIDDIHNDAKKLPPQREDDWVLTFLSDAEEKATAAINEAKTAYERAAGNVPTPPNPPGADKPGPGGGGDKPGPGRNPYDPPIIDPTTGVDGLDPGGDGSGDTPNPWDPPINSNGTSPPNQYPNPTTPSSMGNMDGGMSSMWPAMLSALNPLNNQRLTDPYLDTGEYERDRHDREPQEAIPVPGSPAVAASQNPATPPPAPSTSTDKPANQTSSAPQSATLTPGADGGIDYVFPDGKTQRVSMIVAKALDKAFANKQSTDAQQAYADTTAKWSDNKHIGDRVDPYQLMTGDVGIWENPDRTAIVRAMGSDTEATLDIIVNGELHRYPDEQTPDGTGDVGTLAGWAHPRGIELTEANANRADTMAPTTNTAPAADTATPPVVANTAN
ncbi:hypothetical protein [Nocardia jejuensis]|uniref:hypothetical protein n=1 Tax=Nocardia jejuensis TaxID=328049 RepID=UPI0012F96F34|nr:hypothetical protein [Nocardia jejuensis]